MMNILKLHKELSLLKRKKKDTEREKKHFNRILMAKSCMDSCIFIATHQLGKNK